MESIVREQLVGIHRSTIRSRAGRMYHKREDETVLGTYVGLQLYKNIYTQIYIYIHIYISVFYIYIHKLYIF